MQIMLHDGLLILFHYINHIVLTLNKNGQKRLYDRGLGRIKQLSQDRDINLC